MHTIGDSTAKIIIDTLKKMEADGIKLKVKFVIAHLQLILDDYIPELGKHNIYLNLTPFWVGCCEAVYKGSNLAVGEMDEKWVDFPEERLSLDQLLTGYTINGAIQCSWDKETGSIGVGKSADMPRFHASLNALR